MMLHMGGMHKQTISFTKPQIEFLRKEGEQLGISVADVVRRIVDRHRERNANHEEEAWTKQTPEPS